MFSNKISNFNVFESIDGEVLSFNQGNRLVAQTLSIINKLENTSDDQGLKEFKTLGFKAYSAC